MIETLSTETIVTSPWLSLRKDAVRYPSGAEGTYYVVEKPACACIVPMIGNDIILLRHFRYPVNKWSIEVVGGLIDEGEEPIHAAERELREEAGAIASTMIPLSILDASPATMNQRVYVFLASIDRIEESQLEKTEVLETMRVPFEEAIRMVRSGEITSTLAVGAILLADAKLHHS